METKVNSGAYGIIVGEASNYFARGAAAAATSTQPLSLYIYVSINRQRLIPDCPAFACFSR